MSKSTFHVTFDGPALGEGEIDVRALAPALLDLGDIVQRANRILNGKRADAVLKLKASEKGSFTALLTIDVSMIAALTDLLDTIEGNPDRVAAAKDLIALLIGGGTVLGGTCLGFFKVLKWLKGERPDAITPASPTTSYIAKNGGSIIVDNRTIILLNDAETRTSAQAFSEHALKLPGVDEVRIGKGEDVDDSVSFGRQEANSLSIPAPDAVEPVVQIQEREMLLRIVTAAFRDGYKWRFSDGGEKPFTAEMRDIDFLASVESGKVSLSANDTLRCRVEERQVLEGTVLSKDLVILHVIEHIEAPKQLRLL